MRSRQVYYDCIKAKKMLQSYIESGQKEEVRVLWVSCITLLRSIGYVLHKLDTQKSQKLKDEVESRWDSWKQEEIFLNFIEGQRNNTIKEYAFSVFLTYQGQQLAYQGEPLIYNMEVTDLINEFINNIEEEGIDLISNLDEALQWWNQKLFEVESAVE